MAVADTNSGGDPLVGGVAQAVRGVDKAIQRLESITSGISAVCALIVTVATLAQMLGRSLGIAIPGIYEGSSLMLIAMAFLGLAYAQSKNSHPSVDMPILKYPPRFRLALEAVVLTMAFVMFLYITWESGKATLVAWQTGDYWMGLIRFPTWPARLVVPVGVGLLSMRLLIQILQLVAKLEPKWNPQGRRA